MILRVEECWLRKCIKRLPHVKMGRSVFFTDDDLRRIVAMHHYEPEQPEARQSRGGPHAHAHLKPLPRTRRTRGSA